MPKLLEDALEMVWGLVCLVAAILFFSLLWASQSGDSFKTSLFIMGGYILIVWFGSIVYQFFKKDEC